MRYLPILILFFISGCGAEVPKSGSPIIAKVGSEYLTLADAKDQVPSFLFVQDSVHALNAFREQWIKDQVWVQDSKRKGAESDPEFQRRISRAKEDILVQFARESLLESMGSTVSDAEVQQFFDQNKQDFFLDEKHVMFVHITTDELDAALEAKAELRQTNDYEATVRRYANDKEQTLIAAKKYWPISSVLSDFEPMRQFIISATQVGEISPIRRISEQLHFIKILDIKNKGDVADVSWVQESIKEFLIVEKRRKRLSSYEQNLVLQANANGDIDRYLLPIPRSSDNSAFPND